MSDILNARENRLNLINSYLDKFDVITIKVNMFGNNKNNNISKTILGLLLPDILNNNILKNYNYEYINSIDGDFLLYKMDKCRYLNLKEEMIKIESSDIGRLIDIDVYHDNKSSSIRREVPRKCVICDDISFNCIRSHRHTYDELYNKYLEIIYPTLEELIETTIIQSMDMELRLTPKFGCVCYDNSGSHQDLNYDIMYSCAKTLIPFFSMMFKEGFFNKDINSLFNNINKIGRTAEDVMFKTYNTNCYKGLIFCLGILVCGLGRFLSSMDSIFFSTALSDVLTEYKIKKLNTFGYQEYLKGFLGIRGEVMGGYKSIKDVIRYLNNEDDLANNNKLLRVFCDIVKNIDDTILLKRCGTMDKYLEYKNKISSAYLLDNDSINKLNEECINKNISLGGTCDLLVCTLFLKHIQLRLHLKELL